MTAATHYAFSYFLLSSVGFDHSIALTSSIVALLPDIDHPESLIGRIFGPVSHYIQRRWGHRTVTHSVFAIIAIVLFLVPLSILYYIQLVKFPSWFFAVSFAFSSHIFIDLFNRSGVRLFAPLSNKEYISFRTPELRILVNSWQEYLLLFIIVFLAFSISNKPFSIHSAVRTIGKHFYKTYESALNDYHENAGYVCIATVTYFDEFYRIKHTVNLPILAMYTNKAVFLKDGSRLLLRKEQIDEIVMSKTDNKIKTIYLKGNDTKKLNHSGYYTGTVTLYNYPFEIKSSDYIEIEKQKDRIVLKLLCADISDISFLNSLDESLKREIELLKSKLCSTKIEKLKDEEKKLKVKLSVLKHNFYDNYGSINKLSSELKSIQTKIKTLEMQDSIDQDAEIKLKLEQLNNLSVWYDVVVVEM